MTATRPSPASAGTGPAPADGAGLAERLHALGRAGAPGLVAATLPVRPVDPVALFAAALEADLEAAIWLRPSDGTALVGIGRAWAADAEGPGRFAAAATAWAALLADARLDRSAAVPAAATAGRDAPPPAGPTLLGGLGFTGRRPAPEDAWAPFGAASLVLPDLLLAAGPDGAHLTGALVGAGPGAAAALERRWTALAARARDLDPGRGGLVARPVTAPLAPVASRPARDAWDRLVGMYAGAVGRGRLDKVVLARRVDLASRLALDVPNAVRRLAASAPEGAVYAFRRGGRTFLGATPERLVVTRGRAFRTVAVAGTTGRGPDDAADAALAAALLASDKDREEHDVVVAAIRDLLAPVADRVEVAPAPAVLRLRFVQHLVTEITGTVRDAAGLLALGERLHPTPAVGGAPRELALPLIDEHEGFDRGWYAGPVGWLGADGDGELWVALRCGIVDGTRAALFAGCGIVADSDAAREWEESRIKLQAVVAALGRLEDGA